jgi:ABC-type nitrate/sulfonate/bicarbonate transport system substrate-binding protein
MKVKLTLLVLMTVVFGICTIVESGAQMKKLRLNVFRVVAATVVARAQGWFAAEGLDVETIVTPSSTEQMRGVAQGKFEIVETAFDNVMAWSGREGAEIVAVAQIADKLALPIFVRPEIKNWSDLKGKKLGADALDTSYALVLRRILLEKGLDLTRGDYVLIALGSTPQRLNSMIKGETYAANLNFPFDLQALDAGMRRIGDSKEVLPDYPDQVLAINREWGEKNRDSMIGFLRAWLMAGTWIREPGNREAAIEMVGAELKLNPTQAAASVDEISMTGNLNLPGLQVVLDLRNQFGFKLPKGDKLAVYYDATFLNAAKGK